MPGAVLEAGDTAVNKIHTLDRSPCPHRGKKNHKGKTMKKNTKPHTYSKLFLLINDFPLFRHFAVEDVKLCDVLPQREKFINLCVRIQVSNRAMR